ncbi:efflux RND transporter permease subunit [Thiomicrorhabdus aquaedulcis]|uniref:efflux RND transporter permease subunit n=1 Tax=Thiomicrorhabdus aquaedulcis TaxID=2211106 RepID=UPI000FDB1D7C|nr:efflux RND transporter permease subunit [Thiomicrorhabdus aquaedulcis]
MNRWNVSAYAVKERSLTLYFMLVVALAGAYAFLHMGRAEDPSFNLNTMLVSATWPGATAQQMQNQVADPLEKKLEEIEYFDRVETKARAGRVDMIVSFAENTPKGSAQDLYYQVRKRLGDEAQRLPQGVQGPFFNDDFEDVYFTLYSLTAPKWPQHQLLLEADKMQVALRQVTGVKKVNLIGEQPQHFYIDLDKSALESRGLSVSAVQNAIQAQLTVTDGGFIETAGPRLYVRGEFDSPPTAYFDRIEQLQQLPILVGEQTLLLQDVAKVVRGFANPPEFLVRDRGETTLILGVVMSPATDGLQLEKHLQAFEAAYQPQLPLGVHLDKITNQADAIHSAVSTFELKFMTALLVVLVISLLALGLRAGLIVSLAVPLTLAMTFLFMYLQGLNFDRITLGALIISLGLLVDDAIIAIEMMLVKMEEGMEKAKAAAYSWTVTAAPMLVGTLVTVVGFLPIGLAQSRVGEYAGNIFWVLGITLMASWIVAVYFTPYLGVKLLVQKNHGPSTSANHVSTLYNTKPYQLLRKIITACVRYKVWVVLATLALFVVAAVGMNKAVVKQFFPSSDRPELMVDIYLPEGSSIQATDAVTRRMEAIINGQEEVKSLSSYVGRGAPRFFLALNPELPNPAFAKIIVVTPDAAARDRLQAKLQAQIQAGAFPEARVRVHSLLFGPPVIWPVTFRVVGPDANQLRVIANDLKQLIGQQAFAIDPHLQWGDRVPSLYLNMDKMRLLQIGLTPAEVHQQLQAQLQGMPVAQVRETIRTVNVVVRGDAQTRLDVDSLGSVMLKTKLGQTLPLEQVATIEVHYEEPLLERRNRELYISVNSDVVAGMQPPVATQLIQAHMQPLIDSLPFGYRIDVGGSVEESSKAESSIQAMMPLMLLAMTLLIMLLVKSFSTLFMVMITAPLGLIGAVSAMLLFNQPFGFVANLGLIGLAGILMRNTLILTGQIDDHLKNGYAPAEAVIDATIRRARPVLLTAVAAMLAFIPLTTSTFWGPMAYVLIGGIGVGTLLTLLFLPALYALWFKVKLSPV